MNSLGKSPSKKKNKKNNWGKKPEVDKEKIRAQTKQYTLSIFILDTLKTNLFSLFKYL